MKKIKSFLYGSINPRGEFYLFLFKLFITWILYPIRLLLYKGISSNSYISLRSSIRSRHLITLEKKVIINDFVTLWPTFLYIGKHTQINPGTAIYGKVKIGRYVMIAPNCMITGGNHGYSKTDEPMMFQKSTEKGIVIEDDVWIGANSVILDGVTIGCGSIIGANSLVLENIPPFSIAVGNPSRIIKSRK